MELRKTFFYDRIANDYGKFYDIAVKNFDNNISDQNPFGFDGDKKEHLESIGIFRHGICFDFNVQNPYFAKADAIKLYKITCEEQEFNCLLTHDLFYVNYLVEGEIHFYQSNKHFKLNEHTCQFLTYGKKINNLFNIDPKKLTETILKMIKESNNSKMIQMCNKKLRIDILPDKDAEKYLNRPIVDIDENSEDRFVALREHLNF